MLNGFNHFIKHCRAPSGIISTLIFGISKTDIRHEKLFCWLFCQLKGLI
jgi:hypothetical protein